MAPALALRGSGSAAESAPGPRVAVELYFSELSQHLGGGQLEAVSSVSASGVSSGEENQAICVSYRELRLEIEAKGDHCGETSVSASRSDNLSKQFLLWD